MNTLILPCPPGAVSDGYHTFDELYEHRTMLFFALMRAFPDRSWISNMHHDGTSFEGWSIGGMHLPCGDITYHFKDKYWALANKTGAKVVTKAPCWDGHTSADVLARLQMWIENKSA